MKEYENYTDEELITRIRDGEDDITNYLIDKYKGLVRKKVKSLFILGGDNDDLIQEGMIGLFNAIRNYDFGRDASFITFADVCVTRQILTAIETASRKKHNPLNQYVSLYSDGNSGNSNGEMDSSEVQIINAIASLTTENPEELVINRELLCEIEDVCETQFSDLEKKIFKLYLTGMSYVEIARVLGREEKSTDNALNRCKNKIKKAINK